MCEVCSPALSVECEFDAKSMYVSSRQPDSTATLLCLVPTDTMG